MRADTSSPKRSRYVTDRCEICGRFVGCYPVGFYCDTHCSRCICTRCPGFRSPPSYTHPLRQSFEDVRRLVG